MADKKKPKTRQKKIRKKNNLHRLCVEMNRLVIDANDKEYVRRFKTLIDTSAEEITKSSLDMVLSRPGDSPIYAELANEEGVLLVEGVFSDILSDNRLKTDPIHPNAAGYLQLADGIAKTLVKSGLLAKP